MLSLVERREQSYNNRGAISRSAVLSQAKLVYYKLFALVYGAAGRCAHSAMCNSSWTAAHVRDIWGVDAAVVFPPCNTEVLQSIGLEAREEVIVSVGQFRPEKNHSLQVEAMEELKHLLPKGKGARLLVVGSCRNEEDEARVRAVRQQVIDLGLEDCVEVKVNVAWDELKRLFGLASVGLHTMRNEHFGINVVEFMASGVVPVSHNSGGPKSDIVKIGETGYLAESAKEYAVCINRILSMSKQDMKKMQEAGRKRAGTFSDANFREAFVREMKRVW